MRTWLLSLFCLGAFAQTTTVTGTITDPTGDLLSGSCSIQAVGPFTAVAGWRVIGAPTVVKFSGGAFVAALAPTDSATPSGQYYKVSCAVPQQTVSGRSVGPYSWGPRYWLVPTNTNTLDIGTVEITSPPPSPSWLIQWQQLARNGAQVGQVPIWNGSSWQPGIVSGALSAAAPLSFNAPSGQFSCSTCVNTGGSYADPSWLSLSWGGGRLTGIPSSFNPAGHASTHGNGGSDPAALDASQIATGIFSSARIPQIAYGSLSGIPSTFNTGLLQGRAVTSAAPSDLQYLGWNNSAAQWEPKTLSGLSGGSTNYLSYWTGATMLGATSFLHLDDLNRLFYIDNARGGGVTFGGVGFCCGMYYLQQFTPSGSAIVAFNDTNGFQSGGISWSGTQWTMSGIADSDFEANVTPSSQQMMVNANGSGSRSGTLCNSTTDVICTQNVLVSYYCYVMPSVVGNGGAMTLTISWNDGSNRSFTSASLNLSDVTQVVSGTVPVYLGYGQTITWREDWTNAVVGSSGWVSANCSIKRN